MEGGLEVLTLSYESLVGDELRSAYKYFHFSGGAVQVETSSARVESAWFQLCKLEYEATAFKFCLQITTCSSPLYPHCDCLAPGGTPHYCYTTSGLLFLC